MRMQKANVNNVTVLFEAIVREREKLLSGVGLDENIWFKTIDGPPGRGIFFTGDDGWDALLALTEAAMRAGKISNRADREKVMRSLARVLIRKFVTEKLEVNERNVTRALNEAAKGEKRSLKTETHYIPCQLSSDATKIGVSLGSVRFLSRSEAKKILAKSLKFERSIRHEELKRSRPHMIQAIKHYKGFRWFAEVTVEHFASKRSDSVAHSTATSALDFLQLLIGTRNSYRMSILGHPSSYARNASITRDAETGHLTISTGWSTLGQSSLPDDWTTQVLQHEGQAGLDQAGVVLESRLNPDLDRPLSMRLLDALHWFGEAARDTSPSTQVIKFVTALERLTLTNEGEEVTEIVSNRVAAMTTGLREGQSFEQNKSAFKKVYGLRSALVHGSISPNDPKVKELVGDACDFAEHAIRRALYNWPPSKLREESFSNDELDLFYNELIAGTKAGGGDSNGGH